MSVLHEHPCLIRLLAAAGDGIFIERSAKCGPGRWAPGRTLISMALGDDRHETMRRELPAVLEGLGMLAADRKVFLKPLATLHRDDPATVPSYLHVGLEESRHKVYWEIPLPERPPPRDDRFALYRAWKWQSGSPAFESEYVLLPSANDALDAIEDQLRAMPDVVGDLLEQLQISFALKQTPWPPLSVRIEERGHGLQTPRNSLNLHLYSAGLPLGSIAGLMMTLTRHWHSAPRHALVQWMAECGDQGLSNVSLGVGDDGQPFFTCYHGGRPLMREEIAQAAACAASQVTLDTPL